MLERTEFLSNYGALVARTWDDEPFLRSLQAEPKRVLVNAGFDIPEWADVNLLTDILSSEVAPDTQLELWHEGEKTGVYSLILPPKPANLGQLYETSFLVTEEAASDPCCCCCPCCCEDLGPG